MVLSKILLSGSTGYIGGSILHQLLESHLDPSKYPISVLVRGEEKAKVFASKGVTPIVFGGFHEHDFLQKIASEHDIVIQAGPGFDAAAAKAFVVGLGERKKKSGKDVHYIHTSGTSNISYARNEEPNSEPRIFSDREEIFPYVKAREAQHQYLQRTTDITVIETGLATGVKTTIIMSPCVYGIGSGFFHKQSIQIPTVITSAIKDGQVAMIDDGKGRWSCVNVLDLATLYELILTKILAGEEVPTGEKGIIFSGTGSFSWVEASRNTADALHELGFVKTMDIKSISVEEAAEKWVRPALEALDLPLLAAVEIAEFGMACNSLTSADVSYELGYKPQKNERDFKASFLEEAKFILAHQ